MTNQNKNPSPDSMTSLNAHLVGDLTPEQRQALFDKLRQRKLAQARKPVDAPAVKHQQHLPWQPAQLASPRPQANRLLEITLAQTPDLPRLATCLNQLLGHHAGLHVEVDCASGTFLPCEAEINLSIEQVSDARHFPDMLAECHQRLAALSAGTPTLQACALVNSAGVTHVLLASHPLLLDHYSLLGLAHQWLSLYSGTLTLDTLKATGLTEQARVAQWSSQVLEHKFLNQEWNRLRPKGMGTSASSLQGTPAQTQLELTEDFLQAHQPVGEWRKSWLLNTVHRCLSQTLAHQDIHYWLEAPQLRADAFESQLGYFPYYLPVTRQLAEENEQLSMPARLQRLQTRYGSVSEQLCTALCNGGTQAPLVHYHWFDLEEGDRYPLQVIDVQLCHPGLMLAPVEIHLIERLSGVTLNVHYLPEQISADQVHYLLRTLQLLLQQTSDTATSAPPTLQARLRQIWQTLLQKTDIGDEQSFFDLGGHSLQVTELKFRIKQQLKVDIPISVLYELTTIDKLAHFILATHGSALGFRTHTDGEEEEGTL